MPLRLSFLCLSTIALLITGETTHAASWNDGGPDKLWSTTNNWQFGNNPAGSSVTIGNHIDSYNDKTLVDQFYPIDSLVLSNGADVALSSDGGVTSYTLQVNGGVQVSSGVNTSTSIITLYDAPGISPSLSAETMTISTGGQVTLDSGSAASPELAILSITDGMLSLESGDSRGTLFGNGSVLLNKNNALPTTLLQNDGVITAGAVNVPLLSPPAPTELQIHAADSNARFDWDGKFGAGVLNVNGNATLDIDVRPGDDALPSAFKGVMNLRTGSTIDIAHNWVFGAGGGGNGVMNVSTPSFGFVVIGQDPNPGAAARIAGADWTMANGTINIGNAWDTLQLDSTVNATGGVIDNSGTIVFNANASFQNGVDFNMVGGGTSLVVNAGVNIASFDFDLDGQSQPGNQTTINPGGVLNLALGAGADEDFGHTINLNIGHLQVASSDNDWSLQSNGKINVGGGGLSRISGDSFHIDGDLAVGENSTLAVSASSVYGGTASVVIHAGSTLDHGTASYSGGSYTGGGVFKKGAATILADTTWAVDAVDLDDGSTAVNNGAKLTVNTSSIDDSGDGIDGVITVADTGQLEINLTGGGDVVFESGSQLVYNGNAGSSTFLTTPASGSALAFSAGSQLNINGDGASSARIKLNGSTLNINDAAEDFRMNGGSLTPGDTNEITGGVINGPGELQIGGARALHGHGSINATVDGDGPAQLIATGGTLNVNDGIQDIGRIGTAGAGSVLNVTDPWNTNVADNVLLDQGTLQGATITNDGAIGINGAGLVASRVINNSQIVATGASGLIVDTPANNNDWDGVGGAGQLRANDSTLELRDDAPFLFTGTVDATHGTVFANGFELEFEPGSTLDLFEGTYRSTHATDFGGAINVGGAKPSRISLLGAAFFEGSSTTTLNADLELQNASTLIRVGATFNGGGDLRNLSGSVLTLADGAVVGVQVTNEGDLEIAGGGVGRGDVTDFVQTADGRFHADLLGTGLGDFDRLVTTGIVQLDGVLDLSLFNGFNPVAGDSFTILSAAGGVLGAFASLDDSLAGLDPGLMWQVLHNPTNVEVGVVLGLPGDFNGDSVVDAADYTVWRDNLGSTATLSGDPTPGMVTEADYGVWVANYGATLPVTAAAVPEPATAVLILVAMLAGRASRR